MKIVAVKGWIHLCVRTWAITHCETVRNGLS